MVPVVDHRSRPLRSGRVASRGGRLASCAELAHVRQRGPEPRFAPLGVPTADAIAALETRAALERENAPKAVGISPSASAEQWKAYNEQVNNAGVASQKQADALKGLLNALDKQGNAANRTKSFNEGYNKSLNNARAANDRATKAAEKNKKAVDDQAKAVRTYADYASDLSNVLKRSFELRFGNEIAADNTLDARIGVEDVYKKQNDLIQEQRDKIVDLNKSVRDYDNTIKDLNADLAGLRAGNTLLEYQLGIARKYGDTLGEETILAKIAKNNAEIAKTEAEVTKARIALLAKADKRKVLENLEKYPISEFSMHRDKEPIDSNETKEI